MPTTRIGCVQYLNTLPLIEGLRSWRDASITTAVPSKLIGMLLEKQVDVALCSAIDAARNAQAVTLLPVGMIGCDGPTLTVRVYSKRPLAELDRVCADTDSHTSVALLQVIAWKKHGKRLKVVDFDARERMIIQPSPTQAAPAGDAALDHSGWPEAVLLIGDKVMTDAPPRGLYAHELDLGQAWKNLTGLPFVYALWMCRAGEESLAEIRAAAAMLDRARRHNQTRLASVVASAAPSKGWPVDAATTYLGEYLRYEVGEPEREGLEKFLRFAGELGLTPSASLTWATI
jgi:chorismate dehydratase